MKPSNLTGQKFGRLTAIKPMGSYQGNLLWLCKCSCGKEIVTHSQRLKAGKTKSCGCYNSELTTNRNKQNTTILAKKNRLYRIYWGMRTRCYNTNDKGYKNYGARGIIICKEWLDSFEAFQKWALQNGYKNTLSIDRIDNDGIYEPSNCRWATDKEQGNNRRPAQIHAKRKVLQMLDGKIINEFNSISEAKRQTGACHISDCCKGIRESSKNYQWKYKEEKHYGNA